MPPADCSETANGRRGPPAALLALALAAGLTAVSPSSSARAMSDYEPGDVFRDCETCPEMVAIPAGSFAMGSPSSEQGRADHEGPQHRVSIPAPFAMGKFEVTFSEWDACLVDGGCGGHRPDDQMRGRGRRPVMDVSWEDAQAYVAWLSRKTGERYRLPSESEWEYAARAGTTGPYSVGPTIATDQANFGGDFKHAPTALTVPVGSYPANGFGLHDMHGNLDEWVEDCWHGSYAGAPANGSAWVAEDECELRVVRGGSWYGGPHMVRSAYRDLDYPSSGFYFTGFRAVRTLVP